MDRGTRGVEDHGTYQFCGYDSNRSHGAPGAPRSRTRVKSYENNKNPPLFVQSE